MNYISPKRATFGTGGGNGLPILRRTIRLVMAGGLCASAAVVSSCHPGQKTGGNFPTQEVLREAPIVRICLTARPVSSDDISTTHGYRLLADGKTVSESQTPLSGATVSRTGGTWKINPLETSSKLLVLEPIGGFVRRGQTAYRGSLHFVPTGPEEFQTINHVDLESYLMGVLPKELYASWSQQTYLALAFAARTFAIYHMRTTAVGRPFDLGDDQGSQVYGGQTAETQKSRQAVNQTRGIVLAYGPADAPAIFKAQYSACCGGRVNGAYVLRNAPRIPPLMGGQVCQDCSASRHYRWSGLKISKSDIYLALSKVYPAVGRLGGVGSIRVLSTAPGARPLMLAIDGPTGETVHLRAEDLRLALLRGGPPEASKLYSMNCTIQDAGQYIEFTQGRGLGHGVGLCQWGAQGKAQRGMKCREILEFYYPGSRQVKEY